MRFVNRTYSYDTLGRLKEAKGGSNASSPLWTQSYTYDRYGNRTNVAKSGVSAGGGAIEADGLASLSFNAASNRITTAGFVYDKAGNQTQSNENSVTKYYVYDAAGRLAQVKDASSNVIATYSYGASNQRLRLQEGGSDTYYCWDGGQVTMEYTATGASGWTWSKSYVYLGGRLLATDTTSGVQYHHPDRLGTRLVTNSSGGIVSENIGLPYGATITGESYNLAGSASKKRFTSYDRSDVTGLDYAVNRHYSAAQGRFTQVDPIGMRAVSLSDPQSLNLYAYCGNDPVNHLDPDGLFFKKLFKWIGKGLRLLFKFAAVLMVVIAMLATSGGVALLALGLGAVFGIAGWHNGKLGNFTRTILLAGGANNSYGGFRTPNTFGKGGGVGAVSGFVATQSQGQDGASVPIRWINGQAFGLFKTIDEAATAALESINPTAQKNLVEYGGRICKTSDGYFIFETPRTDNKRDAVYSDGGFCPGPTETVGFYHTHPNLPGYSPEIFSTKIYNPVTGRYGGDTYVAHLYKMPVYLATPSGKIKVYDPIKRKVRRIK